MKEKKILIRIDSNDFDTRTFELQPEKKKKQKNVPSDMGPNEDSGQLAHPHSLISLRCPHQETSHPSVAIQNEHSEDSD